MTAQKQQVSGQSIRAGKMHTPLRVVQSDRGTEFAGEFSQLYVDHLPVLVSSYNSIPRTTTGVAPSDLLNNAEKRAEARMAK